MTPAAPLRTTPSSAAQNDFGARRVGDWNRGRGKTSRAPQPQEAVTVTASYNRFLPRPAPVGGQVVVDQAAGGNCRNARRCVAAQLGQRGITLGGIGAVITDSPTMMVCSEAAADESLAAYGAHQG